MSLGEWQERARSLAEFIVDSGRMSLAEWKLWMGWKLKIPLERTYIAKLTERECIVLVGYILHYELTVGRFMQCPTCKGSGDAGDPADIADYNPCPRCNGDGWVQRGDYYERG